MKAMTPRHKATKVYVFRVTVRVTTHQIQFGSLWDMLRYDSCSPASEADSGKLSRLSGDYDYPYTEEDKNIDLLMYSRSGTGPSVKRWESFGFRIMNVDAVFP